MEAYTTAVALVTSVYALKKFTIAADPIRI